MDSLGNLKWVAQRSGISLLLLISFRAMIADVGIPFLSLGLVGPRRCVLCGAVGPHGAVSF